MEEFRLFGFCRRTASLIVLFGTSWANAAPASTTDEQLARDAAQFLEMYNRVYQGLYTVAQEANWKARTDVTSEHTGQRIGAEQALAAFVGSTYVIEQTGAFLQHTNTLDDLTVRQLRMICLRAAGAPGTVPDVVAAGMEFDQIQWLLNGALDQMVFIPWSAGVMTAWESDFYEADLPAGQLNKRWWEYVARFQGITPPEPRGEEFCDAATKTHINDDPALYYQYAIAFAIKYHLHRHIATKLLHQDPRNCNFYGNKEVGAFLYKGATRDWRQLIRVR
jgi:oligoendopeptidase F